jgi:hypothetical protein
VSARSYIPARGTKSQCTTEEFIVIAPSEKGVWGNVESGLTANPVRVWLVVPGVRWARMSVKQCFPGVPSIMLVRIPALAVRCSKLSFLSVAPAPAAASVWTAQVPAVWKRGAMLQGHASNQGDVSAHWPNETLQPRTHGRMQQDAVRMVTCTWAACSSLNGLQYCARTSALTSTWWQSDSLVSGIRSPVQEGTWRAVLPWF